MSTEEGLTPWGVQKRRHARDQLTRPRAGTINAGACPMRVQPARFARSFSVISMVLTDCRTVQETVLLANITRVNQLTQAGTRARGLVACFKLKRSVPTREDHQFIQSSTGLNIGWYRMIQHQSNHLGILRTEQFVLRLFIDLSPFRVRER